MDDAVESIIEDWRRERPELDTAPLRVLGRLHRSYLRYHTLIGRPVEAHGLSMAGFDVITALRRAGSPHRLTAAEHLRNEERMLAGLTAEDRDALAALLAKLERSLNTAQPG